MCTPRNVKSKIALIPFQFNARVANTCNCNCKFSVFCDVVTSCKMAADGQK